MTSHWNNRQGNRDRAAWAVLVTVNGQVHRFRGESIPGVCHSCVETREKNGKWSSTTYRVEHHSTTVLVGWHEDWETGHAFPQANWVEGLAWMAKYAPAVTQAGFESFIRGHCPGTEKRWNDAAKAVSEFSGEPAAEQLASIEAGKARLLALKAEIANAEKAAAEAKRLRDEAARVAAEVAHAEERAAQLRSPAWGVLDSLKLS